MIQKVKTDDRMDIGILSEHFNKMLFKESLEEREASSSKHRELSLSMARDLRAGMNTTNVLDPFNALGGGDANSSSSSSTTAGGSKSNSR